MEKEIGNAALFIRTDVSSRSQVDSMVNEVMKRFGRVDVLINNVGIHAGGNFGKRVLKLGNGYLKLTLWELYSLLKQ